MNDTVLNPPETPFKIENSHQKKIDDALYTLSIHFDYKFEDVIIPLQHFLKYYSYMFPQCSNVLNSYENVDFCRERFAYVDYLRWKEHQSGTIKRYTQQEVESHVREKIVEIQQVNDLLQEKLDSLMEKEFSYKAEIEQLKEQYQKEQEMRENAEKIGTNLQNDMKQLNKEMQVLRNEIDMYREQFNEKRKEEQEQISQTYKRGSIGKPSGFSIFKDSLKDDFDKIYSSVKENIPQIESDNEEDGDELEIYKTNLPPATEFENSLGRSIFPNNAFSAPVLKLSTAASSKRSVNLTPENVSSSLSRTTLNSHSMKTHNISDVELKRAEEEFENAIGGEDEFVSDLPRKTQIKELSMESIERDIQNQEEKWNKEFESALRRSNSENALNDIAPKLNIPNLLSSLGDLLQSIDGGESEADSTSAATQEAVNPKVTPSAADPTIGSTTRLSREERRRRRAMDIYEHDD